jgi:type II restriction enzyme
VDLSFDLARAAHLRSATQRARVLSEHWVEAFLPCPACGHPSLRRYANNQPVADFRCVACDEDYELKSQRTRFGRTIADGAYDAMLRRLASDRHPNLLLLNHVGAMVTELQVVPKQFFVASMIEKRAPLAPTARRAGWVGCKVVLADVPAAGRISLIRNGTPLPRDAIAAAWTRLLFVRGSRERGWLIRTIACVERLGRRFSLAEVYAQESAFAAAFPDNRNVRAKLRQQLQVLRDRGWLRFLGDGVYERT